MNESINRQNLINLYQPLNICNLNNKRYIIIGNSGSHKTQLAFYLLANDFNKYLRIKFILGGKSKIYDNLKKILEDNNIIIEEYILNNVQDLVNLLNDQNSNLFKLNRGDIVFIDDVTHLMKSSQKFEVFLNKIFTTSRQKEYDIILILHKFKMFNKVIRNNATKLFFTSTDQELIDEFDDIICNYNLWPIVINNLERKQLILNIDDNDSFQDMFKLKHISINQKTGEGLLKFVKKTNNKNFITVNKGANNEYQIKNRKLTKRQEELNRKLVEKGSKLNYKYDEL